MRFMTKGLLVLTAMVTAACSHFATVSVPVDTPQFAAVGMPIVEWKQGTITGIRKEGLSKSLIYGGVSGTTIKLTYRENAITGTGNEYARPAFSQELTYDLNASRRIRFQNVEIDVTQANNEGINYMLTKSPVPAEAAK